MFHSERKESLGDVGEEKDTSAARGMLPSRHRYQPLGEANPRPHHQFKIHRRGVVVAGVAA